MINSCNERIIHIDNPSTNITDDDEETEKIRNDLNEKIRARSRSKLLEHLEKWKAEGKEDCKPRKPDEIKKQIKGKVKTDQQLNLNPEDFKEFLAFVEQQNKGLKCQIL